MHGQQQVVEPGALLIRGAPRSGSAESGSHRAGRADPRNHGLRWWAIVRPADPNSAVRRCGTGAQQGDGAHGACRGQCGGDRDREVQSHAPDRPGGSAPRPAGLRTRAVPTDSARSTGRVGESARTRIPHRETVLRSHGGISRDGCPVLLQLAIRRGRLPGVEGGRWLRRRILRLSVMAARQGAIRGNPGSGSLRCSRLPLRRC